MPVRIDAGRSRVSAPRTGGVVIRGTTGGSNARAIGSTLSDFADGQLQQIRAERAAEQAAADQIDIAKTSSAARLEWQKRLNDELDAYDGAEPGFTENFTTSFRQDAEARLAGLNPRIRQAVELDLVQFGERLTAGAIEGARGKRQAYVMRGLRETLDTEAEALLASPMDLASALEGLEPLTEAAPAALRDKFREEARAQLASAYVDGLLRDDPSELHYQLEAGMLDSVLDAKQKAQLQSTVSGTIARQAKAAEQAAHARRREEEGAAKDLVARVVAYEGAGLAAPPDLLQAARDAAIGITDPGLIEKMELASYKRRTRGSGGSKTAKQSLDVLEKTLEAGLAPAPEMIARARADVEASGTDALYQRLNDIAAAQEIRQEAALMPKADLAARLAEIRSGTVTEEGLKEFRILNKVAAQRERMGGDDNVGWAEQNGLVLQQLDLGSETLAGDLSRRVLQAEALAEMTGEKLQVFSKVERARFGEALDALPADQQADMLARLTVGAGGRSGAVIRELAAKNPVYGQAGYLTATGRGDTALAALQGAKLLKERPDLLPRSKAVFSEVENAYFGNAIPAARLDVRKGITDMARAIYAGDLAREGKGAKDFDADEYQAALQRAAGQSGVTGGIGDVGRGRIQLPAHMTADQVEGLVKSAEIEDWAAWSLGGVSMPSVIGENGMQPVDARFLKKSYLISVGEGRYQVSLTDPRFGAQYVLDGDSSPDAPRPFVLDLSQVDPAVVHQRFAASAAQARVRARTAPKAQDWGRDDPRYQDYLKQQSDKKPMSWGRDDPRYKDYPKKQADD